MHVYIISFSLICLIGREADDDKEYMSFAHHCVTFLDVMQVSFLPFRGITEMDTSDTPASQQVARLRTKRGKP